MLPFSNILLLSLLTSSLLTIRMSVLTTTVEHPINYHQKFFQIILEGVFKDVTVFHRFINPLSALTLCLADTVQLLDKFRCNDLLMYLSPP